MFYSRRRAWINIDGKIYSLHRNAPHGNKAIFSFSSMKASSNFLLAGATLNAMNIDIKGGEEFYKEYLNANARYIWKNATCAKNLGIHVEIVHLIIKNDKEEEIDEIIEKHLKYVGNDIPIHFAKKNYHL